MSAPGRTPNIVQIHPTTRVQPAVSSLLIPLPVPEQIGLLDYETVRDGLTGAVDEGYEVASFSGGEPILCEDLGRMLRHAKELGMRTTVTSNGILLSAARLSMLAGDTDVLAISLDGVPESHDRMGGSEKSFERMLMNLQAVRDSGITFGFIFTLTQYNVNEVAWAAQFAVEQARSYSRFTRWRRSAGQPMCSAVCGPMKSKWHLRTSRLNDCGRSMERSCSCSSTSSTERYCNSIRNGFTPRSNGLSRSCWRSAYRRW